MQSRWNDREAEEFVARFESPHGRDLALRTYTSRLIGADTSLVLHGGGNTSVKTVVHDIVGRPVDVLCIKGSGWDLATIEPQGHPAVDLAPLLDLRSLESLTDEEMVNQLRTRLLRADAPTPSVETLLHAFLPHKFVDHTHADAILELTDQPDGEARVRELFGDQVAILDWIMPGFPLAKAVADACESAPGAVGVVLLKHGIFSFGETARQSYERMIELVDKAEKAVEAGVAGRVPPPSDVDLSQIRSVAAELLPALRGAVAIPSDNGLRRMIATHRGAADLIAAVDRPDAVALFARGPLTPDHVIRTKGPYLVLEEEQARDPEAVRSAVAEYAQSYRAYFERNNPQHGGGLTMLDPHPRVVLVRGVGIFAFGETKKAADVAADLAEHTLRSKVRAEAIGSYEALEPDEYFEMEYWSLEQAKLGKKRRPQLAGRVALVTGAGGAIGAGICEALLEAGAHVVGTDVDADRLKVVHDRLAAFGSTFSTVVADQTDEAAVRAGLDHCRYTFGGLDVLVPNAGIAHVGRLAEMDPDKFRKVYDVNVGGTLLLLKHASSVFAAQGTGGDVVLQASKNVFAPGAGFGAYSASKAGAHQLGKVAALEFAEMGVRVNMINADAVFGDDAVPSGLWQLVGPDRMRARNLDPGQLRSYYRDRSLLKVEVTPRDVGNAVVFFASGVTPTTGATLPVDAGIPGAFPR